MRRVVALGGGHGTAVTLRAARRYASEVTAVVSVADDGGSTGRLRAQLDVVGLGDLRKCLVALAADDSVLARAFEHRFAEGDLAGHALGNLVLAGMVEASGGLVRGIDETARLLQAVGRVLPATTGKVVLTALGEGGRVNGQVAVSRAARVHEVSLSPRGAGPPAEVFDAIAAADQIVIGPGSLYTSVLAAAAAGGVAEAIAAAAAQRVYVCNLRPQLPETEGYDVADHLAALRRHGIVVDVALVDRASDLTVGEPPHDGPVIVAAALTAQNGLVHDPGRLADALADLLASNRPPRRIDGRGGEPARSPEGPAATRRHPA
jgi:uncharacterized cofD-like protein